MRAERLESLGQLAGGIAHDFNNLLAVIGSYATLMSGEFERIAGTTDPAVYRALVEDIGEVSRTINRGRDLTRQLLAFARQDVVAAEPISLNAVVTDLQELLRRTLGEHIVLETQLESGIRAIMADPGQLGQVLVNLAVNSRDAMPEGGRLVIETSNVELSPEHASDVRSGPGVRLRVSDTGAGMPSEVLDHAFEPFFTTKSDISGTGLGLATVYGIVTQAGGRASLYSEPGHGTTFSATFPAVERAGHAAGSGRGAAGPGEGRRQRPAHRAARGRSAGAACGDGADPQWCGLCGAHGGERAGGVGARRVG